MIVPVVVEGQSLRWYGRIPEIADNSIEFVQLEFRFPEDWDNMVIVAQFTQTKTYNCLLVNNRCFLPMELVAGPCEISVFGYLNEEVTRGTTIPLKLNISRSGFVSSAETPIPPTPDLYAQLIDYFSSIAGSGGGGSGSGTINPEDIAAAVEDYLSKNPPEVPDLSDEVDRAETAASKAEAANANASASANNAGSYATYARDSATSAASSAAAADKAATDAEAAAARAEEAAKVTTDLDTTLTQAGKAADAKAVGDAISKLSGGNADQSGGANIYAGTEEPTDGSLVWIDTTEEARTLILDNSKWVKGYLSAGNPSGNSSNGEMFNYEFLPVTPGKTYTFYNTDENWESEWIAADFFDRDIYGEYVSRKTGSGSSLTFTVPTGAHYVIISSRAMVTNDAYLTATLISGEEIPDSGETEKTLTSISATYSGGDVAVGTSVTALTGVTVTAQYSDGTSEAVTNYTLSGEIAEGSNVITVSYGGMNTTFTVMGVTEETEVTLSSISATYSGGEVAEGTALTDLTGVVVTANYSDGTSAAVTGYTLSGTIVEGSNTITVSYGGKTATFAVTGVAESGGEEDTGIWTAGYLNVDGTVKGNSTNGEMYSDYMSVTPGDTLVFYNTDENWTTTFVRGAAYDADKNFVKVIQESSLTLSHISKPMNIYYCVVPEGCSYVRMSSRNMADYHDTAVLSTEVPAPEAAFEDAEWTAGYYSSNGNTTDASSNGEMYSTRFRVEPGATYRFGNTDANWTTDWNRCLYYSDLLTFSKNVQPTNGATLEFTIPDGVHYLAISSRNMADYYTTATFEKVS